MLILQQDTLRKAILHLGTRHNKVIISTHSLLGKISLVVLKDGMSLSLSLYISQTHTHTRGSKHYWIISFAGTFVVCVLLFVFLQAIGNFYLLFQTIFFFFLLDNFNCLGLVLKRVALFHTAYVMLLIYFIIKIFVYIFRM